jgi:hypothetical protein
MLRLNDNSGRQTRAAVLARNGLAAFSFMTAAMFLWNVGIGGKTQGRADARNQQDQHSEKGTRPPHTDDRRIAHFSPSLS